MNKYPKDVLVAFLVAFVVLFVILMFSVVGGIVKLLMF